MNFAGRASFIDTLGVMWCGENALRAVEQGKPVTAYVNLTLQSCFMTAAAVAALVESILLGLVNVIGAPFFNECSLLVGVKQLTVQTLFNAAMLTLGVAMPIFSLIVPLVGFPIFGPRKCVIETVKFQRKFRMKSLENDYKKAIEHGVVFPEEMTFNFNPI